MPICIALTPVAWSAGHPAPTLATRAGRAAAGAV